MECVPPACQLYMLWWPPDVSTGGGGAGPPVNKFEQVSSDGHRMSLARFNVSWVMVT